VLSLQIICRLKCTFCDVCGDLWHLELVVTLAPNWPFLCICVFNSETLDRHNLNGPSGLRIVVMFIVVGVLFQDDSGDELKMSEEEAAKVNEMLDDAARSAVNRLDLRSGFYTDPSAAGSWHHMSDEDITGSYILMMIFLAPFLDFCHGLIDIFVFTYLRSHLQCSVWLFWHYMIKFIC